MATASIETQGSSKGEALNLEQAKKLFSESTFASDGDLSLIQAYYHPDVRFRDAIQQVNGRDAFMEMTRRFVKRARDLKVEVHDAAQTGNVIFLDWTPTERLYTSLAYNWVDAKSAAKQVFGDDDRFSALELYFTYRY